MMSSPEQRLSDLAITLPPPARPLAAYVPVVVVGSHAFVSGHGPLNADRTPAFTGRLGSDLADDDAVAATRLTILNLLGTLRQELQSLDRIIRIVVARYFLVAEPESNAHELAPLTGGRLLADVFGDHGAGCRITIGIGACVLNLPVTIDLVAELV
jgi:enamine deaminase RidA (YjgF/YER057c/UK114 family)